MQMLLDASQSYVMLCYVMLCYVMLCYEQNRTEQNRIFITLKLLQFLVTLHTNTTIYKMLVTKQGIITMDEVCVKI